MTRRVVVLDYGSGNIRSAQRALARAGADVEVSSDVGAALEADGVVIPGVGAFAACTRALLDVGGDRVVGERVAGQRPTLAICVGHQVLFTSGAEHGETTAGLGIWHGAVTAVQAEILPHVGWNTVAVGAESRMFAGLASARFYFVHSYAVHAPAVGSLPGTPAWTSYGGDRFVAAMEDGALWSTQFHPEKSGDAGAALLHTWVRTL